ncbi:MAG: argininosuccinate lyase [Acidimicrobiia bacterium]|nr:argininosuccinate lyase [Acidimicrobiia bacterium]MDH5503523.1 argininosuccinate lyase [Acidimicrobiia bacterium]
MSTLWSGGFAEEPDALLWAFTVDTADRRLIFDDLHGSWAHVGMLGEQGIITEDEAARLQAGILEIVAEAEAGDFVFLETDEDVHSATERRLIELVGEVGRKVHTGRSRNDQIALDLRLYLARSGSLQLQRLAALATVLVDQAERVGDVVVPSYTHLQQAQAVPLAHHLLAYAEMLRRDAERLQAAIYRVQVSPLGAGASGGSSLPLDPAISARLLGWSWHFTNSMDAVGSRDFVAEYVFVCAQSMVHLSRLSEEIVLWATSEFGWVSFPDTFTTGSSAMPQKKNPDVAELVRGRSAAVIGDLTAIMSLQKGLPLTYNRDLQEDKRIVFHADDVLAGSLQTLAAMLATAVFSPPAPNPAVTALDMAEVLVGRNVAFRTAHEAVGRLLRSLEEDGRTLKEATAADLIGAHDKFEPGDLARLDPNASVEHRVSPGGGSYSEVVKQIKRLRSLLEDIRN